MKHDQAMKLLDDYLDALLPREEAEAVEAHLEDCDECRDEVETLRAILADAKELPRSIAPARDLWPAIDARLDATPIRERTLWSMRYPLAAAAALMIAISSALTAYLVNEREAASSVEQRPTASSDVLLVRAWRSTEDEYLKATVELLEALEILKERLPPETAEMVETNLRIIDEAIQESRAALAVDPSNGELVEALSARYRTKLEVLQQVNRLAARS
jgi:predicted anti-sigma-YlaC factor YlaD